MTDINLTGRSRCRTLAFITITAAIAVSLLLPRRCLAVIYTRDPLDNRTQQEQLEDFQNASSQPNETLPAGHWAYAAVQHFADMGLLDGYERKVFADGRLITRYEMALLINKIFKNYLSWSDTGVITTYQKVQTRNSTVATPAEPSGTLLPEPPGTLASDIGEIPMPAPAPQMMQIQAPPALINAPKTKDVEVVSLNGGSVTLKRSNPRSMSIPVNGKIESKTPATSQQAGPDESSFQKRQPVETEPQLEDRVVQIEKKVDLTQKDIDTVEKLVNSFKKELQGIDDNIRRDIKDTQRLNLKNSRQIEDLKLEDERFKITGSDSFSWQTGGPWTGDGEDPDQTTNFNNSLSLKFTSKPEPKQDFTVSGTMKADTVLGARTGYYGYIEGTNTALSLSELFVSYQNTQSEPGNEKNFSLRSLQVGNISAMFSPLTVYGRRMQGINLALKLNNYTLNFFGSRMAYHYGNFLGGYSYYVDNVNYDRYLYGMNVNTAIFGEQRSMGNFSKIFMLDNKHTTYPGCELGYWVDLNLNPDPSAPKVGNTDISNQDFFCGAPEKNSVESAFIRYPIFDNLYVTSEYAHSTYFKPGYGVVVSPNYIDPNSDDYDDLIAANPDYKPCDVNDINDIVYNGSGSACWIPSKERSAQDDAFLLLFDYAKGPIKMFPVGYVRLGPEFVTKYFGLPGFDLGSAGLDISILPISLQGLEAYIGNFTYDKEREDNYKYTTYYVTLNETHPMYFDPAALAVGLSNNSSKADTLKLIFGKLLDAINNRRETLKINVWNNSLKYYLSDKINLELGVTKVKVILPKSCLDSDRIAVLNEQGAVIGYKLGNGRYECDDPSSPDIALGIDVKYNTQSLKLNWQTSKKASVTTGFGINDSRIHIYSSRLTDEISKLVADNVNQGKYFSFDQSIKYKLTSSTDIEVAYTSKYDRMPDSDDSDDSPTTDQSHVRFSLSTSF
jgi:hypothetical protein